MKPTKNRVFCRDSGRQKMLFETEKKADTFIRFNAEEIEEEAGYSPIRSYFCIACAGWHVTSKKEGVDIKSKTERVIEAWTEERERKKQMKALKSEEKKLHSAELNEKLSALEEKLSIAETLIANGSLSQGILLMNEIIAEVKIACKLPGSLKRKETIDKKLALLLREIEAIGKRNIPLVTSKRKN